MLRRVCPFFAAFERGGEVSPGCGRVMSFVPVRVQGVRTAVVGGGGQSLPFGLVAYVVDGEACLRAVAGPLRERVCMSLAT
eukprot:5756657-Pleurochrysis_carterae.AAC.1